MPGLILRSVTVPGMGACREKRLSIRPGCAPRFASLSLARSASLRVRVRLSSACSRSLRGAMPLSYNSRNPLKIPVGEIQIGHGRGVSGLRLPEIRAIQYRQCIACANSCSQCCNGADYPSGNRRGDTSSTNFVISNLASDGIHQWALNQFGNGFLEYIGAWATPARVPLRRWEERVLVAALRCFAADRPVATDSTVLPKVE